jgi:hypothetical protein
VIPRRRRSSLAVDEEIEPELDRQTLKHLLANRRTLERLRSEKAFEAAGVEDAAAAGPFRQEQRTDLVEPRRDPAVMRRLEPHLVAPPPDAIRHDACRRLA